MTGADGGEQFGLHRRLRVVAVDGIDEQVGVAELLPERMQSDRHRRSRAVPKSQSTARQEYNLDRDGAVNQSNDRFADRNQTRVQRDRQVRLGRLRPVELQTHSYQLMQRRQRFRRIYQQLNEVTQILSLVERRRQQRRHQRVRIPFRLRTAARYRAEVEVELSVLVAPIDGQQQGIVGTVGQDELVVGVGANLEGKKAREGN